MRRSLRLLRLSALTSVLILAGVLISGSASAQSASEPPTWDPPPGHNVTTVRWGPFTIPPAHDGQHGHIENEIALDGPCNPLIGLFTSCRTIKIEKPCEDCYITGVVPDLVFAGTNTSVNYNTGGGLHHMVNVNFSRPDVTCPPGLGGPINLLGLAQGGNERVFASGNERTIGRLFSVGNYGYFVRRGDRWGLISHLNNLTPEPITVEYKYTFSWVRSAIRVDPVWLDIDQCDDSEASIPAGYSDTHWSTRVLRGGTLVAIGAHAHDHNVSVSLQNVTKNRYSCVSPAGYAPGSTFGPVGPGAGTAGHPAAANTVTSDGHPNTTLEAYQKHVSDFTTCYPFASFDRGDEIRVHAQYNRPAATEKDMGIMVAYVRWR